MALTLEEAALWVADALTPLEDRLKAVSVEQFLSELGLPAPDVVANKGAVLAEATATAVAVAAVSNHIPDLRAAIASKDLDDIKQTVEAVTPAVKDLVTAVMDLATAIDTVATSASSMSASDIQDFAKALPERLFGYLLSVHLEETFPPGHNLAVFLGLVEFTDVFKNGDIPAHTRRVVRFDRIGELISDPFEVMAQVYNWGDPAFDWDLFMRRFFHMMAATRFVFLEENPSGGAPAIRIAFVDITATADNIPGLRAETRAAVAAKTVYTGTLSDTVSWEVKSTGAIEAAAGIELHPKADFQIVPPSASVDGDVLLGIRIEQSSGQPTVLLGTIAGTRLEARSASLSAGAELAWDPGGGKATGDLLLQAKLEDGRIVLNLENADGFLGSLLPDDGLALAFEFTVTWSESRGLQIEGGAGLEVNFPVHREIGPIALVSVHIGLFLDSSGVALSAAGTLNAKLGPLFAAIERMGASSALTTSPAGGSLGLADFSVGFDPPTGVGLSLDSSAIKGGGFLSIDRANERYAGVLELSIKDKVDVTAVGLITTRLPGGEDGFSLLISISAEFEPIQLGLGFTLNGVGGLLGLNRTAKVEVLRAGIKGQTLDNILFPTDVVGNASTIISDLRSVFPPEKGRFIIMPMAIIGWGQPTLISVEMGVLIELPAPLRVAILGVLRAILPTEDKALLKLQVNFLGVIEFEKRQIAFDASIFDSKLVQYSLSGDMALRISWGSNSNFLLSVGGFHPRFQPPPNVPSLARMTLSLTTGNNPRITIETYFALTSNTAQVGAHVDLFVKVTKNLSVEGHLGFDALFEFSPFYMLIEAGASMAVKWKGKDKLSIYLDLSLDGPSAWHANGKATFKVLGIEQSVKLDKTWGKADNTTLPDISVWPLLKDALETNANWEAVLPSNKKLLVSISQVDSGGAEPLVVHPLGTLQISQKVVPLDLAIEVFGNQKPAADDPSKFKIQEVRVGSSSSAVDFYAVRGEFAPAQFRKMDGTAKLSSASFKDFNCGVRFRGAETLSSDYLVKRKIEYEAVTLDSGQTVHGGKIEEDDLILQSMTRGTMARRSGLSHARNGKSALAPAELVVLQEKHAVVRVDDLTPYDSESRKPSLEEAEDYLGELILADPMLKPELLVVPEFEVQ